VGTQPTGKWIDDDIVAIATLQEEYGYTKDGKVGPSFFRFLDRGPAGKAEKDGQELPTRVSRHHASGGCRACGRRISIHHRPI
jgi:hypothetical protein